MEKKELVFFKGQKVGTSGAGAIEESPPGTRHGSQRTKTGARERVRKGANLRRRDQPGSRFNENGTS